MGLQADRVRVMPLLLSDCQLSAVIELGDASRNTLGFLPRAGYIEAAAKDAILVALTPEGQLIGYCLYDVTRRYVRVVHVCVGATARGSGVAAALVDAVQERYPDLLGLKLKCRRDWSVNSMWPKLGFQPITDVRGRSHQGHQLTVWFRSNHQPDLFEPNSDDLRSTMIVAVDTNIFSDLHTRKHWQRKSFSGALALLAGEDLVQLALPTSLAAELNRTVDSEERQHFLHTAANYLKLGGERGAVDKIRRTLLAAVQSTDLNADSTLTADARLIAESILGGAEVFTTRDVNCIRVLGPISFDHFGLIVIDPTELPTYIDQQNAMWDYQPARLGETAYEVIRGSFKQWSDLEVLNLIDKPGGERKSQFNARLRSLAEGATSGVDRYVLIAPDGKMEAMWAVKFTADEVEVPLIRVAAGKLHYTITLQLLFNLRNQTARRGAQRLTISDPHVGKSITAVLESEGLEVRGAARSARVLKLAAPWSEVANLIHDRPSDLAIPTLSEVAELERLLWPLKIIDSELPSYFIPINSLFADELLAHRESLVERRSELGLSREHVYYRSHRAPPSAPGRILWYASGRDQQVVACSRLIDSVTGTPESLHAANQRLGVWSLPQIRERAKAGRVGALRFADTEIFASPISLKRLRELSEGWATLPSRGPVRIDGQLFADLYIEGTAHD